MRILIAAVGRSKAGPMREIYDDYVRRLAWPVTLREVEIRHPLPPEAARDREAELLLRAVPAGAIVIALDERGRSLSSAQFAEQLRRWRDGGSGRPAFLIGGAAGHGAAVRERADMLLSLGPMTWPHLMVRCLLAEQLYRAHTILSGHPYHRE